MARVLFLVRIKVPKAIEAEFSRWYAEEHVPDILKFPGAVDVHLYRTLLGDEDYQRLSAIEFEDEEALRRYLDSDYRARLSDEFDSRFGETTQRVRAAYEQIYP